MCKACAKLQRGPKSKTKKRYCKKHKPANVGPIISTDSINNTQNAAEFETVQRMSRKTCLDTPNVPSSPRSHSGGADSDRECVVVLQRLHSTVLKNTSSKNADNDAPVGSGDTDACESVQVSVPPIRATRSRKDSGVVHQACIQNESAVDDSTVLSNETETEKVPSIKISLGETVGAVMPAEKDAEYSSKKSKKGRGRSKGRKSKGGATSNSTDRESGMCTADSQNEAEPKTVDSVDEVNISQSKDVSSLCLDNTGIESAAEGTGVSDKAILDSTFSEDNSCIVIESEKKDEEKGDSGALAFVKVGKKKRSSSKSRSKKKSVVEAVEDTPIIIEEIGVESNRESSQSTIVNSKNAVDRSLAAIISKLSAPKSKLSDESIDDDIQIVHDSKTDDSSCTDTPVKRTGINALINKKKRTKPMNKKKGIVFCSSYL